MKTLVIHPEDESTDFLKQIYENQNFTVETRHKGQDYSIKEFIQQVKDHDRIIMLGHGYPGGLFYSYIDRDIVYLLREKECVCIWCNADQFVKKYKLTGFYTGMFISEVSEAKWFGIKTTQEKIDHSNNLFAQLFGNRISDYTLVKLHGFLTENYVSSIECPVINFNKVRLYYRDIESLLAENDLNDEVAPDYYLDI
jgi:hypothetical protein